MATRVANPRCLLKMVDVSRRSNFLPILKDYHSSITLQNDAPSLRPHQWQATAGIRQLMEKNGLTATANAGGDTHGAQASQRKKVKAKKKVSESSKAPVISVDGFKREYELEVKRRKNKRLDNVLRTWDASLQWERDQRHHNLLQRVRIQRELITKNDQLANEIRRKAEDEHLDRIQSRRRAQREAAEAMRAHIIRVEEHKKKIAEKLKEMTQQESRNPEGGEQVEEEDVGQPPGSPTSRRKLHIAATSNTRKDGLSPRESLGTSTPLVQLLGESEANSTFSVGAMWGGWRADAIKRLQPIVRHSHHLKQVASPSVKQFLDIYERPTAQDRFTGKPIPLGDILDNMSHPNTAASHHTTMNNALQVVLDQTQRKANIMLRRKDPYNNFDPTTRSNEGWFVQDPEEENEALETSASEHNVEPSKSDTIRPLQQRNVTSIEVKKQLPSYLMPGGDLVSGSLEELGEYLYCGPSKGKTPPATKDSSGGGASVFLTDLQLRDDEDQRLSDNGSSLKLKSEHGTPTVMGSRWQPLTSSALTEHKSVTEVPVKGPGHLAHGRYKVWRPNTCIVNT